MVVGKDSEERIAEMVSMYGGKRVLVHYGGQSALRSGLIDKVCEQLGKAGIAYSLLGGVVPNPLLSKVYEGIDRLYTGCGWRKRDRLCQGNRLWSLF